LLAELLRAVGPTTHLVGAVRLGDEVEGIHRAPRQAELKRPEVAVLERAFRELVPSETVGAVERVFATVTAVTHVQPEPEPTGRAETLFGDELWPVPNTGIAAEVLA